MDDGAGNGKPLDLVDFSNGEKVNATLSEGQDPMKDVIENGNSFDGDIKLSQEQADMIRKEEKESLVRSASTVNFHKWPKSGSVFNVPYVISSSFTSPQRANIARAISEFKSKTCIR